MSVIAVAKNVRISPRKIHDVASLVRGRSIDDAVTILEHTPRRGAAHVSKVIQSAASNAVHNNKLKKKDLYIELIEVGYGIRMKRFRPKAMGRANPYVRRTSNIRVVVSEMTKAPAQTSTSKAKSTAAKPATPAKAVSAKKPVAAKNTTEKKEVK